MSLGSDAIKTGKIKQIYNFEGEFTYVIKKEEDVYSVQEDSIIGSSEKKDIPEKAAQITAVGRGYC